MAARPKRPGRGEAPDPRPKVTMTLAEFMARELPPLADIVSFCNHLPMSPYADSTVVKSPEVVFRGLATSRNPLLSEEYLLNFGRSEADMAMVVGTNNYKLPVVAAALAARGREEDESDLVLLPAGRNERAPIGPVIRSRRSRRKHSGRAVDLEELATVLAASAGVTGHLELATPPEAVTLSDSRQLDLRAVSSGGALYPVSLCILALRVEGVPAGAYRYLPKQHALKPVGAGQALPPARTLAQVPDIDLENAAFLVVYVYDLFANSRKYGEAGLAFAFLEAGGLAAHVHLMCTALGLGSCDVGAFAKHRLERLLGADGLSRHVIHLTVVGK